VSSALVLGSVLGLVEALALGFLAGPILTIMGVGSKSPMRLPAVQYLAWRAIGAPAVVVALTIQGVFRGFKDTKTPLYANLWGNLVNVVLDPILMFALRFGVSGAAVATVLAQ
jgi:Na+-driven multidrug efflux pump